MSDEPDFKKETHETVEGPTHPTAKSDGVEKLDRPFSYLHNAKMKANLAREELKELNRISRDEDEETQERRQRLFHDATKLAENIGTEIMILKGDTAVSADKGGSQQVEGEMPESPADRGVESDQE